MKRRDFIINSAGVLGAAPLLARAATPCPVPQLSVEGGDAVTTACSNADLTQACASLSAGQSTDFSSGGQSAFNEADLAWQTSFHHDDLHGLVHLMGKPANADDQWKHEYYTLATNRWTVVGTSMWDNPGHIYGNFTMDPLTGDVFQQRSTGGRDHPRQLAWWKFATKIWGFGPPSGEIYSGAMETHANGVAFHPNLYGPGDGGAVWNEQAIIHCWRKSTNAIQHLSYSYGATGEKESAAVYWPSQNKVIIGGANGSSLCSISPNGGGTPILTMLSRPPITTGGHSHESNSNFGSLHVHPGNPSKLLIVETVGQRAYTSTNGTSWTQVSNHPFTAEPRVVCSLRGGLGALWAIAPGYSRLWKPAA
jgi:hypothetical protein